VTRAAPPLALLLLAVACAAPLGDDFERAPPAERDARAVDALRAAFTDETREVTRCDAHGVAWVTSATGRPSSLRWVDVDAVEEHRPRTDAPLEVLLFVRAGSPSAATVFDMDAPLLAAAGLARPYVRLAPRAPGTKARVVDALLHLQKNGDVAPVASASEAAVDSLVEAERRLRALKQWRDEGLITEEEYEAKRREVLDAL
jgi:hypothetical protein